MASDPKTAFIPAADVEVFDVYSNDIFTDRKRFFGSHLGELVLLVKQDVAPGKMDARFMQQLHFLRTLQHENLLKFHGLYVEEHRPDKTVDVVYAFPEGGTLSALLFDRPEAELTWPFKLKIAQDAANALKVLHDNNVLHNDLRSYNLVLNQQGDCLLMEFATSAQLSDIFCPELVRESGDLTYMAPEVLRKEGCCGSADMFSFGLVLWEIACRRPASQATRHAGTFDINFDVVRTCMPENAPPSFLELIRQCLLPEPELRPTIEDVVEWLMALSEEHAGGSMNIPTAPPLPFGPKRAGQLTLKAKANQLRDTSLLTLPAEGPFISRAASAPVANTTPRAKPITPRLAERQARSSSLSHNRQAAAVRISADRKPKVPTNVDDGYIIGTRRDQDVQKKGYMLKKVRGIPYWKKRWFMLDRQKLSWCDSEAEESQVDRHRHFDLGSCVIEHTPADGVQLHIYRDLQRHRQAAQATHANRMQLDLRLACSSPLEAELWMTALATAVTIPRCAVCRVPCDLPDTVESFDPETDKVFCSVQCARFLKAVSGRGLEVTVDPMEGLLNLAPRGLAAIEEEGLGAAKDAEQRLANMKIPTTLHEWLDSIKLPALTHVFESKGYDSILHIRLAGLTFEDLDYLGIQDYRLRHRLLRAATELRDASDVQLVPYTSPLGDVTIVLKRPEKKLKRRGSRLNDMLRRQRHLSTSLHR